MKAPQLNWRQTTSLGSNDKIMQAFAAIGAWRIRFICKNSALLLVEIENVDTHECVRGNCAPRPFDKPSNAYALGEYIFQSLYCRLADINVAKSALENAISRAMEGD